MNQLIQLMTVVVVVTLGQAAGQSSGRWASPLAHTQVKEQADHLSLHEKVKRSPQHHTEGHNIRRILEVDPATPLNTVMHKSHVATSLEDLQDNNLNNNILSVSADSTHPPTHTDTTHNDVLNTVFHKGDVAVPYDSLGWFSRTVEVAMDGSLYVGLAISIMFVAASMLSGAFGLFGETCLICSFIGYANTVAP